MARRRQPVAKFHHEREEKEISVASSIRDAEFYGTHVQSDASMQNEMVLSEVSLLRTVVGIHLKDQGDSERIDQTVMAQIAIENREETSQRNAPIRGR